MNPFRPRPTITQWTRHWAIDADNATRHDVEVPDTDMVRVPRAVFERVLIEAGYTPEEPCD